MCSVGCNCFHLRFCLASHVPSGAEARRCPGPGTLHQHQDSRKGVPMLACLREGAHARSEAPCGLPARPRLPAHSCPSVFRFLRFKGRGVIKVPRELNTV